MTAMTAKINSRFIIATRSAICVCGNEFSRDFEFWPNESSGRSAVMKSLAHVRSDRKILQCDSPDSSLAHRRPSSGQGTAGINSAARVLDDICL